jgi:hypothetical protein
MTSIIAILREKKATLEKMSDLNLLNSEEKEFLRELGVIEKEG